MSYSHSRADVVLDTEAEPAIFAELKEIGAAGRGALTALQCEERKALETAVRARTGGPVRATRLLDAACLVEAIASRWGTDPSLDPLYEEATRDTIERFEATGPPVITDGEQWKYHDFWTYCVEGLPNTAPGRLQDPLRGRPRAADAAADGRPVPLPAARRPLPELRTVLR